MVVSNELVVQDCNHAALAVLGIEERAQLVGHDLSLYMAPNELNKLKEKDSLEEKFKAVDPNQTGF